MELGALLHDIGEIRTPETLLQKPGPLAAEERRVIEQHPAAGVDLLEAVPLLTPALAVVDALDVMAHDRPYRPGRPVADALEEVRREAGKQFDPRVVEAALAIPHERWAELLGCSAADAPSRMAGVFRAMMRWVSPKIPAETRMGSGAREGAW